MQRQNDIPGCWSTGWLMRSFNDISRTIDTTVVVSPRLLYEPWGKLTIQGSKHSQEPACGDGEEND